MPISPPLPLFSAHDLIWHTAGHTVFDPAEVPEWGNARWPVVVRRDRYRWSEADGVLWVPVGMRGLLRQHRHPAWLAVEAVRRVVSPEQLLARLDGLPQPLRCFPTVQALQNLVPLLDETGLVWGPTGSTGFALATGHAVLRSESDLDVVVRAPDRLTDRQISQLTGVKRKQAEQGGCRLDIQIDTGLGGFALDEWLMRRGEGRVLLKTAIGPLLTADPWACVVERMAGSVVSVDQAVV